MRNKAWSNKITWGLNAIFLFLPLQEDCNFGRATLGIKRQEILVESVDDVHGVGVRRCYILEYARIFRACSASNKSREI